MKRIAEWSPLCSSMHRAKHGDGVQQVHVGAWRVPDDGARPAQAPIRAVNLLDLQDGSLHAPQHAHMQNRMSKTIRKGRAARRV